MFKLRLILKLKVRILWDLVVIWYLFPDFLGLYLEWNWLSKDKRLKSLKFTETEIPALEISSASLTTVENNNVVKDTSDLLGSESATADSGILSSSWLGENQTAVPKEWRYWWCARNKWRVCATPYNFLALVNLSTRFSRFFRGLFLILSVFTVLSLL